MQICLPGYGSYGLQLLAENHHHQRKHHRHRKLQSRFANFADSCRSNKHFQFTCDARCAAAWQCWWQIVGQAGWQIVAKVCLYVRLCALSSEAAPRAFQPGTR